MCVAATGKMARASAPLTHVDLNSVGKVKYGMGDAWVGCRQFGRGSEWVEQGAVWGLEG